MSESVSEISATESFVNNLINKEKSNIQNNHNNLQSFTQQIICQIQQGVLNELSYNDIEYLIKLNYFCNPFYIYNNTLQQSFTDNYYEERVNELKCLIEERVTFRMVPNLNNKVNRRNQMYFDVFNNIIGAKFILYLSSVKCDSCKVDNYYLFNNKLNGNKTNKCVKLTAYWNSLFPPLATKYWFKKKWQGEYGEIWRAEIIDFKIIYLPDEKKLFVEFSYQCQFYNKYLEGWQFF